MKNKEFKKLLKKQKFKSNSGFTLTELLVGLFMSIFVIGALGFGLMTVLRTTQSENSKVAARNENSRALDFISDELRRARNIETDATNARTFNAADKTVVLALDIPEISENDDFDTDNDESTTNERIVYYLKSTGVGSWKGPQVLYRWGPPLNAAGEYTNGTWGEQALIDGINDITVTNACIPTGATVIPAGTTVTPATPQGFYACVSRQNSTTAYDAVDNPNNTAQLFLTGQTKTAFGVNDTQTNDSQVVARARTRAANTTNIFNSIDWDTESLGGAFNCNSSNLWDMRTDFHTVANPTSTETTTWIQSEDTGTSQPQPIVVNPDIPLIISSSAVDATGCTSRGNEGTDGSENLSDYSQKISHTLNFGDPKTFNGDIDTSSGSTPYNNSQVISDNPAVQFLKKGYEVPLYGGYDSNRDGDLDDPGEQASLGRFLYDKGIAILKNPGDDINNPATQFIIPTAEQLAASSSLSEAEKRAIRILGDDQRIIAIEMGQDSPTLNGETNPGFDLQDNIFVVTSDIFKKKFDPSCFTSGGCSASENANASS